MSSKKNKWDMIPKPKPAEEAGKEVADFVNQAQVRDEASVDEPKAQSKPSKDGGRDVEKMKKAKPTQALGMRVNEYEFGAIHFLEYNDEYERSQQKLLRSVFIKAVVDAAEKAGYKGQVKFVEDWEKTKAP